MNYPNAASGRVAVTKPRTIRLNANIYSDDCIPSTRGECGTHSTSQFIIQRSASFAASSNFITPDLKIKREICNKNSIKSLVGHLRVALDVARPHGIRLMRKQFPTVYIAVAVAWMARRHIGIEGVDIPFDVRCANRKTK